MKIPIEPEDVQSASSHRDNDHTGYGNARDSPAVHSREKVSRKLVEEERNVEAQVQIRSIIELFGRGVMGHKPLLADKEHNDPGMHR